MHFWYPYNDFADASQRLGRFTDEAVRPTCGIAWSDGMSVALVRRPLAQDAMCLNFVRRHIHAPVSLPLHHTSGLRELLSWVFNAVEASEVSRMQAAQAEIVPGQVMLDVAHDDLWLPAHAFLLRHKLFADAVGVALDFVGVCAGVGLAIVAAPILGGSLAAVGTVGALTGFSAGVGSLALLGIDSTVFFAELFGDDVDAKRIEDNHVVQWTRVVATLMLLPDIPVGGIRTLKEISKLSSEARAGASEARAGFGAAAAQRDHLARMRNPAKHLGQAQRRVHRARALFHEAGEQRVAVRRAQTRMAMLTVRDVNASFVASPGSAALLTGLPPAVLESKADIAVDERLLDRLKPEGGMPTDVKLEARISTVRRNISQ